jgi:hypothetical protein
MSRARFSASAHSQTNWPDAAQLARALRSSTPALLFGVRLWASVCLALYVAYWLELDNPFWAGTAAAIVCQPSLGASLRKSWFRMAGTVVGAAAIVAMTACFPQDRVLFLVGLALWCAVCGFFATLLHNFASYSAALAGYTAAIIGSEQLGATGGPDGQAFMLVVTRVSEIWIGIICAGMIPAGTDFGGARRRLAGTLLVFGPEQSKTRPVRHDLIRRVIALEPVIDEALRESSDLRPRSRALQAAVGGLFAALSGWWSVAVHLELLRSDRARREANIVLENIPLELRSVPEQG